MSEDGPSVCELCGGALRRVLFPAGIIFKGSGFYQTDYRSESYKSSAKADQEAAKPSGTDKNGTSGTGGAEAKSEASKGGEKSPKSAT